MPQTIDLALEFANLAEERSFGVFLFVCFVCVFPLENLYSNRKCYYYLLVWLAPVFISL